MVASKNTGSVTTRVRPSWLRNLVSSHSGIAKDGGGLLSISCELRAPSRITMVGGFTHLHRNAGPELDVRAVVLRTRASPFPTPAVLFGILASAPTRILLCPSALSGARVAQYLRIR